MWCDSGGKQDTTIIFTIKCLQKAKFCIAVHMVPLTTFVEIMSIMKLTSCSHTTGKHGGGEYDLKNAIPSLYKWPESFCLPWKRPLSTIAAELRYLNNPNQKVILWVTELQHKVNSQCHGMSTGKTRSLIRAAWDPGSWHRGVWGDSDDTGDTKLPNSDESFSPVEVADLSHLRKWTLLLWGNSNGLPWNNTCQDTTGSPQESPSSPLFASSPITDSSPSRLSKGGKNYGPWG